MTRKCHNHRPTHHTFEEETNTHTHTIARKQSALSLFPRPNKKIPVFRVTRPYLKDLLVNLKPRIFSSFLEKNTILCIKYFFSRNIILKKMCSPTLPKIFIPVTRNTLIFFGPNGMIAKLERMLERMLVRML